MTKQRREAILIICIVLLMAIVLSTVNYALAKPEEEEFQPLYTVTYERVGGTDENPMYAVKFEWHGEEPLTIYGAGD